MRMPRREETGIMGVLTFQFKDVVIAKMCAIEAGARLLKQHNI